MNSEYQTPPPPSRPSTMTQVRINNRITLHIHNERTDTHDFNAIANEFHPAHPRSLKVFHCVLYMHYTESDSLMAQPDFRILLSLNYSTESCRQAKVVQREIVNIS